MKVAIERGQRLLAGSAERSNFDEVKVRASERDVSALTNRSASVAEVRCNQSSASGCKLPRSCFGLMV